MNWKLIFQLSLFGLAMGIATVFVIPSTIEPFCWLVIFLICAYIIATRVPDQYFMHGLMVSLLNSVWITSVHVLLFDRYVAGHPSEMQAFASVPVPPRAMMLVIGPLAGVVFGFILGLFSLVASRLVGRARGQAPERG